MATTKDEAQELAATTLDVAEASADTPPLAVQSWSQGGLAETNAFDPISTIAAEYEQQPELRNVILGRVLTAENADDLFAMFDDRETQKWLEVPVTIHSFVWGESSFEESAGYFAICDVTNLDTGERQIASFGGENCIVQLWGWRRMGALPVHARLVEAKRETKNGYKPRHFAKVVLGEGGGEAF